MECQQNSLRHFCAVAVLNGPYDSLVQWLQQRRAIRWQENHFYVIWRRDLVVCDTAVSLKSNRAILKPHCRLQLQKPGLGEKTAVIEAFL